MKDFSQSESTEIGVFGLLHFQDISQQDRTSLLLELVRGCSPLTHNTRNCIRELPLFTSRERVISSIGGDVAAYWCENDSVLDDIQSCMATHESDNQFVILMHSMVLVEQVYPALGVTELTFIEAAKRFICPLLPLLCVEDRLMAMSRLKQRWGHCRGDRELVEKLRVLEFIPPWTIPTQESSVSEGSANLSAISELRKASQVYSWRNEELVMAVRCTDRCRATCPYFPPSLMR